MANQKSILEQLVELAFSFLSKKINEPAPAVKAVPPISVPVPTPAVEAPKEVSVEPTVNWEDPTYKISKRFTVKDATYLNSWKTYHKPSEEEKKAILEICVGLESAVDAIEKSLGKTVIVSVHAWMRPNKANCPGTEWDGKDYNRYIYETQVWAKLTAEEKAQKHVPLSPHRTGHAVDFHIGGYGGTDGCASIRKILLPELEKLGLRMEDIVGGWVHLDNIPVVHSRFFKP